MKTVFNYTYSHSAYINTVKQFKSKHSQDGSCGPIIIFCTSAMQLASTTSKHIYALAIYHFSQKLPHIQTVSTNKQVGKNIFPSKQVLKCLHTETDSDKKNMSMPQVQSCSKSQNSQCNKQMCELACRRLMCNYLRMQLSIASALTSSPTVAGYILCGWYWFFSKEN